MTSSITLDPQSEAIIDEMVRSGRYASPADVVREALNIVGEREARRARKLEALRELIREGEESGPAELLDMEEIKATALLERQ